MHCGEKTTEKRKTVMCDLTFHSDNKIYKDISKNKLIKDKKNYKVGKKISYVMCFVPRRKFFKLIMAGGEWGHNKCR